MISLHGFNFFQMICVERVSEYSKVESEADLSKVSDQKLVNWPKSGDIEVNNLSIRYRSTLPLSLSGISFSIKSGQKVGVVGRTGSGKSTLVQALFRILEAETGSITIDGVDISTLGLHKLRMGMSVISQYPVLFSGCTVRENLDPFEQYSDDAIKEALDDVQMVNAIDNLPDGLQYRVAEGGSNFSVGERQLLCLARATLQKSRILVLDEPTANIDIRTDQLLQEAVKKSFPGGTIVSVAHRLDTIIDNDVVLVLGAGKVLEFDSPHNLIEKNGHFAKMVNDTGAEMSNELRRRALANSK
jgi:ABC-type multidrug transport system fused ATPase/permease subunit